MHSWPTVHPNTHTPNKEINAIVLIEILKLDTCL